jgi:acyl-CoA thioesterase I
MIMFRRFTLFLAALTITSCSPADEASLASGAHETPVPGDVGSPAAPGSASGPGTAAPGGADAPPQRAPDAAARNVLFVGTSLTAGYGVGDNVAWPAIIQQKIDAAGLPFRAVNAGISGETSAGGLRRIDWSLQAPVDVLVLELGANDGLRGLDPDAMRRNLTEILRRTRDRYPDAALVVVGMEAPPNLGDAYTAGFRRVYIELARDFSAAYVPFLLDGVAGDPALNIDDGIHPNAEGHRIAAANVWPVLEPILRQRAARPPARQ